MMSRWWSNGDDDDDDDDNDDDDHSNYDIFFMVHPCLIGLNIKSLNKYDDITIIHYLIYSNYVPTKYWPFENLWIVRLLFLGRPWIH